jgi:hypothetical protein
MKTIKLSAKMIASILNEDVHRITSEMERHFREKIHPKSVYDCTGLKIMRESQFEEPKIDLLAAVICQSNNLFILLLRRIVSNRQCIQKINLVSQFSYYQYILEDKYVQIALDKLAEYHVNLFGDRTLEYKSYLESKTTQKKVAV